MDVGVSGDIALATTSPIYLASTITDISTGVSDASNQEAEGADDGPEGGNVAYEYPEGGLTAWLVVVGAFSMLACTFGMMSSVGVLQSYWQTHQLKAYSPSAIGWISSVFVFLNLGLGVQVGPLFDRYGPRWIMGIGSFFYALSIFLLGSCEKYYQFMLCLGLLGGVSSALVSTPCLAALAHWFRRRVIGLDCFADSRFAWATMGIFFAETVLFASLGLIPTYALAQGLSSQTGFYLLAVLNGGSAFGRSLPGMLSDRFGRFNTISAMIALTIVLIFVMWYPFGKSVGVLYPFAFLFGFGTGSIISLTPVCVGQICKTEEFGKWFGTCYFVVSFGTLICIPISGQLLDVAGPTRLVAFLGGVLALSLVGADAPNIREAATKSEVWKQYWASRHQFVDKDDGTSAPPNSAQSSL
ncbi:hypothetical protein FQN54_005900 [Arachnomyces sp. PD_36]|nr:hypothetical protein FQN54_005900 [Arachnomyces sp. PD_36]